MAGANTISLLALLACDLVDMYFLSRLGHQELAAAIGFAGILLFFLVSVGLGMQIAMAALVARAEGQHNRPLARRLCTHALLVNVVFTSILSLLVWFWLSPLLELLGARERTLALAVSYCELVVPATPLLVCGMCAAAALRALGDARRSLWVTLVAAAVTLVLDPLFIVGMGLEIRGAAFAALVSRLALAVVGMWLLAVVHRFLVAVRWQALRSDMVAVANIAGPSILTTLATPVGSGYVLRTMADYGDSAVAGVAILGRILPVVFAFTFGIIMAMGPIVGQNAGAGRFDRVRQALLIAIRYNALYALGVWCLMLIAREEIITLFGATGEGARLIHFYLTWLMGGFLFVGVMMIAVAGFNNLHLPVLATGFNVGRVLLGVLPLVTLGSIILGARGILLGEILAMVLWGSLAFWVLWRRVGRIASQHIPLAKDSMPVEDVGPMAFSSGVSQLGRALELQECSGRDADR